MARVDRRKRFELTESTPVEQRPQIWVEGRQQPRFKVGPYVTVSFAIAKRDLLPDLIATEARLRGYGDRVRQGEVRANLTWAGRFASAMPEADSVAGWITSVADVYAGARARLEGRTVDTGPDDAIAYPDLLKTEAKPRKPRPRRTGEATPAKPPAPLPETARALVAEPTAEAAIPTPVPDSVAEPSPLFHDPDFLADAFNPPAGPADDAGATATSPPPPSAPREAPLFPEPDFLADVFQSGPQAPLAETVQKPADDGDAPLFPEPGFLSDVFPTSTLAPAAPEETQTTSLPRSQPTRIALDDEILAFDSLFQAPEIPTAIDAPTAMPQPPVINDTAPARRLDDGFEEDMDFWLEDEGSAAPRMFSLAFDPDYAPVEFAPTKPVAAVPEPALTFLALDPDVHPEDGLEGGGWTPQDPPAPEAILADPLPDPDIPGLGSAEESALSWAVAPATDPLSPPVLTEAAELPETAPIDPSLPAPSPEDAIRSLFAELIKEEAPTEMADPVMDALTEAEIETAEPPRIDPDLNAIRLALGGLEPEETVPAEPAAPEAAPAPTPAPQPVKPAALDPNALQADEALAREKTALARMLSGFEDLHDPDAEADAQVGPWGAKGRITPKTSKPARKPRRPSVVIRMGSALARGIGHAVSATGRGVLSIVRAAGRGMLAALRATGRGLQAALLGLMRAIRPILRPVVAWAGRTAQASACWTLLILLMAFALPGGAVKAMIYYLDGGDLSDWS